MPEGLDVRKGPPLQVVVPVAGETVPALGTAASETAAGRSAISPQQRLTRRTRARMRSS
jgi:hypothetical protein